MLEQVLIPIPKHKVDLVSYFQRQLKSASFDLALDLNVDDIDERAVLIATTITEVEVQGNSVTVYYDVSYDAYYGCKDIDGSGIDDRHVVGLQDGSDWVFDEYKQPQQRSTFEEF